VDRYHLRRPACFDKTAKIENRRGTGRVRALKADLMLGQKFSHTPRRASRTATAPGELEPATWAASP
jgi:hypothetical protein